LALILVVSPGRVEARMQNRSPQAVVTGRVVDEDSGEPLAGVDIGVRGVGPLAITDDDGEFSIDPFLAGAHVLWARRIGYAEREDSLVVAAGTLVEVTMELSTEPIELAELEVVVLSPVLHRSGFYVREAQGYRGHFLTLEEIRRRNPSRVSDLFRNMPGMRVVYGGIFGAGVFVNQRVTFEDTNMPGCRPTIWIDGARSTLDSFDEMRVEVIEGMEVYAGATAPGKFNDICGTVAIWTRVPIR